MKKYYLLMASVLFSLTVIEYSLSAANPCEEAKGCDDKTGEEQRTCQKKCARCENTCKTKYKIKDKFSFLGAKVKTKIQTDFMKCMESCGSYDEGKFQ